MPELGPYGSVRGARGNSRLYRDPGAIATDRIFMADGRFGCEADMAGPAAGSTRSLVTHSGPRVAIGTSACSFSRSSEAGSRPSRASRFHAARFDDRSGGRRGQEFEQHPGGEAELGIQLISEIVSVPGAELLGPLPAELQATSVISAGIVTTASEPDGPVTSWLAHHAAPTSARP